MARISGIDLPRDKRIEIGLTYIYGIGRSRSKEILAKANVNPDTHVRDLTDEERSDLENIDKFKKAFIEAMEDDLNTADAIAAIFELVKYVNTNLNNNSNKKIINKAYEVLEELTDVLGILSKKDEILEEEILELIEKRTEARKNKDYKLSDEIRDLLKDKGIILEDTQDGVKWKRV